jgi:hypothetical protein
VQIIERFRTWHTLRRAPFICVHGAIIAIDAAVAIISCSSTDKTLSSVMNAGLLSTLDGPLNDLSQTWPVAQDARSRLREILNAYQLGLGPLTVTPSAGIPASITKLWPESWETCDTDFEPMLFPPPQDVSRTPYAIQGQPSFYLDYLMSASLEGASGPLDHENSFNSDSWNPLATSESGRHEQFVEDNYCKLSQLGRLDGTP